MDEMEHWAWAMDVIETIHDAGVDDKQEAIAVLNMATALLLVGGGADPQVVAAWAEACGRDIAAWAEGKAARQ
jgi:hypothetical protein